MKRSAESSNGTTCEEEATPEKMKKIEDSADGCKLTGFKLAKQLNCLTDTKTIFLQVEKDDQTGVVILEKQPFDESIANRVISEDFEANLVFENDIYSNHKIVSSVKSANEVKTTLIYPATERHILKYSAKMPFVFEETAEMYENFVKAFFKEQALNCKWVYNILEKKSESERIICEDPCPDTGFICVPDLRASDLSDVQNFHALAIVNRRDLMSIRDLNSSHLELLKNVQINCLKAITAKFPIKKEQLRVFFHYQPSFYHLHIHFASIYISGAHVQVERAHLLRDVIQNIDAVGDFYQRRTITYVVNEQDPLMKLIAENVLKI
ncbi:m7GpppX diphosphatase-like [Convolutriloba macropyga]|uniref:m7GpppX diphosphatase-like n=1 Tax=Convolutriloba macropyga TaxID=536237 RepID=UPI003F51CDA1